MSLVARAAELGRDLQPLGLAARERGRRLAQPEVAEADVLQHAQPAGELGCAAKNSTASSTVMASTSAMLRPR